MKSKLLLSGAVSASATLMSRILGMVRDIAIASILGAGVSSDVFFFANRIPNFFRRLFAEGAFSQAFVPVMSKAKAGGNAQELDELLSKTAGTLGGVVLLVTMLGMLASPLLTALFGWGWFQSYLNDGPDAVKFTEASFLLRITFPYLFFITLTAMTSSILNVFGKFAVPSITPCILNLSLIGAALLVAPHTKDPNTVLAYGMVVGGILQLAFQIPFVLKLKIKLHLSWGWRHPGVTKIRSLMIPAVIGVSASQLNLLVNTVLASFLATGAISYLYYSDRLLEFPIGIFAVAISTVILPALSKIDRIKDKERYVNTLDWGVKLVLLLGIPSMCGIIALKEAMLRVIFMRGAFTDANVMLSSASLLASASGLCAIMLVRVLVQGFAALQDTKTPVRCSIVSICANIVFNLCLIVPLGYVGLALSTALAAYVNAFLLLFFLYKRNIYVMPKSTVLFILKALISGLIMAFIIKYLGPTVEQWLRMSTLKSIATLALWIVSGGVVYLVCCLILGIRPAVIRQ